ncbi:hypothetical protein [Bacillus sp. FSL W8-0183]|uniref:hypothetical protein n=1 Tax=Bacillus sp. FSL W8-0183 TaxID=2954568 RepID=UPI0030FBA488
MYLKFSLTALFSSLFTFFILQISDKIKDAILAVSTVDLAESKITESLLTGSLFIVPAIFLVLSAIFYYMHTKGAGK